MAKYLDITGLTYLWKKIKLAPYPVGSIYTSENSTSPAELFGGTWEQLKDRFLLATGDTYEAGSTGGEAEHTLTVDELAYHAHGEAMQAQNGSIATAVASTQGTTSGVLLKSNEWHTNATAIYTGWTGGSKAHNNMPPYLAVYMWKRIA